MPDANEPNTVRFDEAVAQVDEYLCGLPGARRLTEIELRPYPEKMPRRGWRLNVEFSDGERQLDVLVGQHFPFEPPCIALVGAPAFLTWPHVERDGGLCLLSKSSEVDSRQPQAVVDHLLREAVRLVQDLIDGKRKEEFDDEFLTYWSNDVRPSTLPVRSLLNPTPPSRVVYAWLGKSFYLIAETAEDASRWLSNRLQSTEAPQFAPAAVIWLNRVLRPSDFPGTVAECRRLAEEAGAESLQLLEQLLIAKEQDALVVFGMKTRNGPCFAAVVIPPPQETGRHLERSVNPLQRGFRPGKVPAALKLKRHLGMALANRLAVDRFDASWVHGRDQNVDLPNLVAAKVAILGCGSLGSTVANMLAQAGVGRFLLVDPEYLAASNTGRHVLGSPFVDKSKAESLANVLRKNWPHIQEMSAHQKSWRYLTELEADPLEECNVIVSAMGSFREEGALNSWHLRLGRKLPIIYGWLEPHGCASHAVTVGAKGGCLQCGLTAFGRLHVPATEWTAEMALLQEPACGAMFQPYGPTDLARAACLTAESVLDCILRGAPDSTHRVWLVARERLLRAGGRWSTDWLTLHPDTIEGGRELQLPWPRDNGCRECH